MEGCAAWSSRGRSFLNAKARDLARGVEQVQGPLVPAKCMAWGAIGAWLPRCY